MFAYFGDHCLVPSGYASFTNAMAQGLSIRTLTTVQSVVYNSPTVHVRTGKEDLECDAAVVTVPLSILQQGSSSLLVLSNRTRRSIIFDPPLPKWKLSAIHALGFGNLNKVALVFPQVFWPNATDFFGSLPRERHYRGAYYLFWNLARMQGRPLLMVLIAGKAADDFEKLSEVAIVTSVLDILQSVPHRPLSL